MYLVKFLQLFSVSIIPYSSEHNFILEHGFELTHSSMLMLTNNPDKSLPSTWVLPRVEHADGAVVVEGVAGARARGILALEPRGGRVDRVPVAKILISTIVHNSHTNTEETPFHCSFNHATFQPF